MSIKDQEREALEKIREIVDGLGEDSYIAVAFEGCFEIAEDNINNDLACSMAQIVELSNKEAERVKSESNAIKQEISAVKEVARVLENENAEFQKTLKESLAKLKAAEDQIIRLKARLFDLIDQ